MTTDKLNDGVGKKIVEALKMQSSDGDDMLNEDIQDYDNSFSEESYSSENDFDTDVDASNSFESSDVQSQIPSSLQDAQYQSSYVDNAFQQSLARNLGSSNILSIPEDFDYPPNVAVLKQLISKLPSGVSRQTGAIIIRQTMEALGISMPGVIQEAKQVREALINNSKECQSNISEYRRQITILESKSQQYQRQSAVMNEIINLFVQTN